MKPFAWILSKVDKKHKLAKWRSDAAAFVNARPLLKTLAKIALISYTVVTLATQLISFPAFSAGLTRKNSVLKDDYAAAAACIDRAQSQQSCTPAEILSLKKAWDNDILMCYGHGTACLADKAVNPLVPPKNAGPLPRQ